jgi:PTS system nitrogen regulatory IIA component
VADNGVDFEALDQLDCRIFILTLSTADKTGPHLQFLAEVSLLFRSEEKRNAILSATSPEEVLKVLTE